MRLTARDLLKVDYVLVRLQRSTRRHVRVHVTLLQPRVVVAGEAVRRDLAEVHALVQALELPVQLVAAFDVEAVVLGQNLLLLLLLCSNQRHVSAREISAENSDVCSIFVIQNVRKMLIATK